MNKYGVHFGVKISHLTVPKSRFFIENIASPWESETPQLSSKMNQYCLFLIKKRIYQNIL